MHRSAPLQLWQLLVALLVVPAALLVTLSFPALFSRSVLFPFITAVVVSISLGGLRAGLVSCVLALPVLGFVALPHYRAVSLDAPELYLWLSMYTGMTVIIGWLYERGRRSQNTVELRFRQMADSAPVLIWMCDSRGQCTYFNRAWLTFTGRTLEQERGDGWAEGVHPDDHAQCLTTFRGALAERRPFRMDYRLRRHDGAYRWVVDEAVPEFDPNGSLIGFIGSCLDIHDLKSADLAKSQLTSIIESSSDAIMTVAPDGTITSWNRGAEQVYGWKADEVVGTRRTFELFVPPDRQDEARTIFARIQRGEIASEMYTKRVRKNGTVFTASISAAPLYDARGRIVGMSAIARDVSERARLETELRASEERTRQLYAYTAELADATSPEQVLTITSAFSRRMLGSRVVALFLLTADERSLHIVTDDPIDDELQRTFGTLPLETPYPVTDAVRSRSAVWLPTPEALRSAYPALYEFSIQHNPTPATAAVPLISHYRVIGTLGLSFEGAQPFDADQQTLIEAVARQCAQALERAQLYADLRVSEERFRKLFDSATVGLLIGDDTGAITYVNPRLEQMLGYSEAELRAMHWSALTPERFHALDQRAGLELAQAGVATPYEKMMHTADGREIPVLVSAARLMLGSELIAAAFITEMTDLKRAQERVSHLLDITTQLSRAATVEEVAAVIVHRGAHALGAWQGSLTLLSEDGTTLHMIEQLTHQPGTFRAYQAIPMDEPVFLTDAIRLNQPIWIHNAAEYRQRYPRSFELLPPGTTSESVITFPLMGQGSAIGALSFGFDRSLNYDADTRAFVLTLVEQCSQALERARLYDRERDARHHAELADELKIKFLAMISHELRTPLTSIKGFATTLLADDIAFSPARQRQFLEVISDEADKLTELISQLLDLSRLQAGTLGIHIEEQPLEAILSIAAAQLDAISSDHHLVTRLPPALPLVLADARRIAQVLVNLVNNAVKFSPLHSTIEVSARLADHMLEITVRDEGIGIPLQAQAYVFEAFRQVDDARQEAQKGAGLGLAICKGLVERHGGRIWISQTSSAGTTIAFTLPTTVLSEAAPG